MHTAQSLARSFALDVGLLAINACADPTATVSHPPRASRDASSDQSEWSAPVNLGATINTPTAELQVGIAPNGRTLFFSSARSGTLGQQDLFVSARQPDGTWGPVQHLPDELNDPLNDSSPTLSQDGHYLYFSARRAGGYGGLDCWRSYRADPSDDLGWGPPENLGSNVNTPGDDADCFPFRSGGAETLWFTSFNRPGGQGDWDIYTSEMNADGTFAAARPRLDLNTPLRETRMTLTGDGRRIYFTSNRPGGLGGIDIWTAERATPRGEFCSPVNMGAPINSPDNDRSPSITLNGAELYFTSTRPGGFGNDDIYVVEHRGGHAPSDCKP
jgi:Tol biopolymer transport system component